MSYLKTITALIMAAMTACSQTGFVDSTLPGQNEASDIPVENTSPVFEDEDYSFEGYDIASAVSITFDGEIVSASDASVKINGADATITKKGTYLVSGKTDNGSIIVDVESGKVKLLLNGAELNKDAAPAVNVISAKSVTLTLMENTHNILSDSGTYVYEEGEDEPDATVFSKDDLVINGSGSLEVKTNVKNGIKSKDTLIIAQDTGNLTVTAANNGISGKDYLTIYGGNIMVKAENHALRSTEKDDPTLGYIRIVDGSITAEAGDTAINAESDVYIRGGRINIVSAEGSKNASININGAFGTGFGGRGWRNDIPTQNEGLNGGTEGQSMPTQRPNGRGGDKGANIWGNMNPSTQFPEDATPTQPPQMPEDATPTQPPQFPEGATPTQSPKIPSGKLPAQRPQTPSFPDFDLEINDGEASEDDSVGKGIKAENLLSITGGELTIDAADDAIHSNNTVTILGGSLDIKCGDDAIHADKSLTVSCADINVTTCYEGLESELITIDSGNINIVATDDAINSASSESTQGFGGHGGMGMAREGVETVINGGVIKVSAGFDGIDTNGNFTLNGGEVYISCRGGGGDGAIDPDGTVYINGGKVLAIGPCSMANRAEVAENMTYTVVNLATSLPAGKEISLVDASGNSIMSATFDKNATSVIVITDALSEGDEFGLASDGGASGTYTATKSPMGAGGFGGGRNFGGRDFDGTKAGMNNADRFPVQQSTDTSGSTAS